MPKKVFFLQEGKQDPIQVEWKGMWKNLTITHGGKEVGVVPNQKQLKQHNEFVLEDGRSLSVQLKTGVQAYLDLQVDGKPLPGSGGDPDTKVKTAAIFNWVIGGLQVVVGIVLIALFSRDDEAMLFGGILALVGAIIVGLGFLIRKAHVWAIILTIVLVVGANLLTFFMVLEAGGNIRVSGAIVIPVFWVISLGRAIGGANELKKRSAPDLNSEILDA